MIFSGTTTNVGLSHETESIRHERRLLDEYSLAYSVGVTISISMVIIIMAVAMAVAYKYRRKKKPDIGKATAVAVYTRGVFHGALPGKFCMMDWPGGHLIVKWRCLFYKVLRMLNKERRIKQRVKNH